MIKREIKVEYVLRKSDGKFGFDYNDILEGSGKEYSYQVDAFERSITFNSFKNNGKLSKTERDRLIGLVKESDIDLIAKAAEDKLAKQLKIESETAKDTKRALELAKIVDDAARKMNFAPVLQIENSEEFDRDSDGMVTIKEKTSHSDWYQSDGGFGHTPSLYLTRVPKIVEKEARELQDIRRKHQGDETFDFWKTSYSTQEVRIADHFNY